MLAVLAADGARLDAGSVALALARSWSNSNESVLLVDADASGARLAQRFGAADNAEYSPAERGLASLIVARETLTLKMLARHCYSLDTAAGSLWALFGPHHPSGADLGARWLSERVDDLAMVDAQRRVALSSTLETGARTLTPVLWACDVLVVLAPVGTVEAAGSLWQLCRELGLSGRRCSRRALIVEGDSQLDDDEIGIETGMHVAGRLPVLDDDRILRSQTGRRERAFSAGIDGIAPKLLRYWQAVAAESKTAKAAKAAKAPGPPGADLADAPLPALDAGVNGAHNGLMPALPLVPEIQHDAGV